MESEYAATFRECDGECEQDYGHSWECDGRQDVAIQRAILAYDETRRNWVDTRDASILSENVTEYGGTVESEVERYYVVTHEVHDEATAREFLELLGEQGRIFHLEDDPATVVNGSTGEPLFDSGEVLEVRRNAEATLRVLGDEAWDIAMRLDG